MLTINTNLSSLIVQSSLQKSTFALNQAIERMTTGFKINGAKDNAAGYSIAAQMSTKISAYQVAEDNAAMGLDLLMTAGDSLSLISEHFTRIRDLTIQAKNGAYGEESMKAINSEVNARLDEIQRLYDTAEFNGLKLFCGESSSSSKTGFINDVTKRDTSTMTTLASVDENTIISKGTYSISTAEELAKLASMTNNYNIEGGEFVLANDIDLSAYSTGEGWTPIGNGPAFGGYFDGNGYSVKNLYINRPNEDYQGLFGCTWGPIVNLAVVDCDVIGRDYVGGLAGESTRWDINNCYTSGNVSGSTAVGGLIGVAVRGSILDSYSTADITGVECVGGLCGEIVLQSSTSASISMRTSMVSGYCISGCSSTGNVEGRIDTGGAIGRIYCERGYSLILENVTSGDSIKCDGQKVEDLISAISGDGSVIIKDGCGIKPNLSSNRTLNSFLFQVGIDSSENSQIEINTSFVLTNLSDLRNIGVSDGIFLETIDSFLASISAKQTEYGACQNRLESALEEINTHYENLVSSRSTLRDADVAKESSAYIRNQILQQASAALLATANQSPAIALQLI